jgi:hypothetical protein
MPLYEVKYYGKENWEDISDIDLLQKMHETLYQVIPAIQQLLEGDMLLTPEAVYRLKAQGKAKVTQANI